MIVAILQVSLRPSPQRRTAHWHWLDLQSDLRRARLQGRVLRVLESGLEKGSRVLASSSGRNKRDISDKVVPPVMSLTIFGALLCIRYLICTPRIRPDQIPRYVIGSNCFSFIHPMKYRFEGILLSSAFVSQFFLLANSRSLFNCVQQCEDPLKAPSPLELCCLGDSVTGQTQPDNFATKAVLQRGQSITKAEYDSIRLPDRPSVPHAPLRFLEPEPMWHLFDDERRFPLGIPQQKRYFRLCPLNPHF